MTAREYYKKKFSIEPKEDAEFLISMKEILDLQDEFLNAQTLVKESDSIDLVSGCSLEELQVLKKIYKEKVEGYSGVDNYREAHEENIRLGVIELLISKSNNR